MIKTIKILAIILAVVLVIVVIAASVIIPCYGWKLGFEFCDSPLKVNTGTMVKVTENSVTLNILLVPPVDTFSDDIIYKIEGNVLKVGVHKIDTLIEYIFGYLGMIRGGVDDKVVPIPEGVVIDKVILCGGGDEKVIWTREEGNIN